MIEKIKPDQIIGLDGLPTTIMPDSAKLMRKINELIDAVNALVKENNIHEKQIDELQMKLEPEKCETPVDQFAEQRKWIGCLCRFWNFKDGAVDIGILKVVDNLKPTIPYISDIDCSYEFCEPVKPDDNIIYKGE